MFVVAPTSICGMQHEYCNFVVFVASIVFVRFGMVISLESETISPDLQYYMRYLIPCIQGVGEH